MTRRTLPTTRTGITHRVKIHAGPEPTEVFITVNTFPDTHQPAEVFLTLDDTDEHLRGAFQCWAIALSLCLQEGVSLERLVRKYSYQRFPPAGFTDNPTIPTCQSIPDYVVRWIDHTFGTPAEDGQAAVTPADPSEPGVPTQQPSAQ